MQVRIGSLNEHSTTMPFAHIYPSTWNALSVISPVPFIRSFCPISDEGLSDVGYIFLWNITF